MSAMTDRLLPVMSTRFLPGMFCALSIRRGLVVGLGLLGMVWAGAQTTPDAVWRCGSLITNQPMAGQACEPMNTLAPTIIEGTQVNPSASRAGNGTANGTPNGPAGLSARSVVSSPATENNRRSAQDIAPNRAQAKDLLHAELKDQEARLQELLVQWRQGQPKPLPEHAQGSQAHLDRVTAMRQQLLRTEADIAALRRELARLP